MPQRRHGGGPAPDSKPRARSAKSHPRGSGNGEAREDPPSEAPTSLNAPAAPVKAWLDANLPPPQPGGGRDPFRASCPSRPPSVRTPPLLPEKPEPSGGLFELLPTIARRALALGLAAREPSFHVFVSAQPEVMIEDDVVRFAERFAKGRETPPDIVYVHDFDKPEGPQTADPPGRGGRNARRGDGRPHRSPEGRNPVARAARRGSARDAEARPRARVEEQGSPDRARIDREDARLRDPRGARRRADVPDFAR